MSDIYFDFSATNNGNGTTAAQATGAGAVGAYNTTDGIVPVANDTWWIRRSGVQKTVTNNIVPVNGLSICGWPVSGDENYDERPASGITNGWDGDTNETHAEIYRAAGVLYYISTTVKLHGFYTSRMKYICNGSMGAVKMDGRIIGAKYIKCEFHNLSISASYDNADIAGNNIHVSDCAFTGGAPSNADVSFIGMTNSLVENCTINFGIDITSTKNCTFSNIDMTMQVDAAAAAAIDVAAAYDCRIENMNIDSSIYTGVTPPKLITGGSSFNCYFDITIKGPYTTITLTMADSNITIVPATSGDTINFTTASILLTRSSMTMENFTGTSIYASFDDSIMFLKNCSVPDNSFTIANMLNSSALYSLNHGGVQGYWKAFNQKGIIESSDVYRTGGSANSLRCMLETANADTSTFPTLGGRHRGEVIYLDLLAGTHTITMYGAHRLFANALTKNQIFMEMDWLDANGFQKSATSTKQGDLDTDASVWVGDTDLTVFSISKTITIPTDQKVPVRLFGTYPYEASAYIYIDPIPVVS